MTGTSEAEKDSQSMQKEQVWPTEHEPQKQNKIAHNKEQIETRGRLGHLCETAASATRRVGDSAAAGFLSALLPLLPLCCLYFFVLLLYKPD